MAPGIQTVRRRPPMRVILLPARHRVQAAVAWGAVQGRLAAPLATSWEWTDTWLRHFGDVVPHQFAIGDIAGEPRAVALLTRGVGRRRGPVPIRTLHLGTAGEPVSDSIYVEHNGLLVAAGDRREFASALVRALHRRRDWDELVLDGFVPDDAAALIAAEPSFVARREGSPTFDLAATTGGDVVDALRPGVRCRIRRSLSLLGDVHGEWAVDAAHALDVLDELIALHTSRWRAAGEPGAFASARFRAFHRDLAPRLVEDGAAVLFRARGEDQTLGCLYCLIDGDRALFYQSGLARYDDNRIRPGLVAHVLCMRACRDRGLAAYEFLAGQARYKQELATGQRELVWASARRPGPRWVLVDGARGAQRALKAVRR